MKAFFLSYLLKLYNQNCYPYPSIPSRGNTNKWRHIERYKRGRKDHDQTCPPSDFFCFFFLFFSCFVSSLSSVRLSLCARISNNLVFLSRNTASEREDINCWRQQKSSTHILLNLEKRMTIKFTRLTVEWSIPARLKPIISLRSCDGQNSCQK